MVGPAVELGERLVDIVPTARPAKVWFGHSGSDANEIAARLVRRSTGRRKIITFLGSFHGITDGSAALSGHKGPAGYAPASETVKIPYPNAYRPAFGLEPRAEEQAILKHLEADILTSVALPDDTAAVFVEAIQSDGGDICPSPAFLSGLEKVCRKHGILLVLDEVKVGLGRSGAWSAFEESGVTPDAVILGKAIGGGLPLSAVVGSASVLDAAPAQGALTTSGNAFSCAAGLAVIATIERQELVENAASVGTYLKRRLSELASSHPLVGDVRGRGLVIGVELVRDRLTKEPADRAAALWLRVQQNLGSSVLRRLDVQRARGDDHRCARLLAKQTRASRSWIEPWLMSKRDESRLPCWTDTRGGRPRAAPPAQPAAAGGIVKIGAQLPPCASAS